MKGRQRRCHESEGRRWDDKEDKWRKVSGDRKENTADKGGGARAVRNWRWNVARTGRRSKLKTEVKQGWSEGRDNSEDGRRKNWAMRDR